MIAFSAPPAAKHSQPRPPQLTLEKSEPQPTGLFGSLFGCCTTDDDSLDSPIAGLGMYDRPEREAQDSELSEQPCMAKVAEAAAAVAAAEAKAETAEAVAAAEARATSAEAKAEAAVVAAAKAQAEAAEDEERRARAASLEVGGSVDSRPKKMRGRLRRASLEGAGQGPNSLLWRGVEPTWTEELVARLLGLPAAEVRSQHTPLRSPFQSQHGEPAGFLCR